MIGCSRRIVIVGQRTTQGLMLCNHHVHMLPSSKVSQQSTCATSAAQSVNPRMADGPSETLYYMNLASKLQLEKTLCILKPNQADKSPQQGSSK